MFKRRKPDALPATKAPPQKADSALPATAMPPASGPAPNATPARQPDTGIGVPPFRPVSKEAPLMGRSPFSATPAPPSSQPAPGMANSMANTMGGSTAMPAAQRPTAPPNRSGQPAERRTLVVGRGISVQGTVTEAERLVVEGTVEASMIHATELVIALGGVFKGEAEVEDTEIAGTIDGTLTARGNLVVRSTGKVLGTARCRRLQVEDGGQITGRIEMITGEPSRAEPPSQDAEASPS